MRAGNKLLTLLLVCMLLCSGCAGNNGKTEPSETSDKQSVSDRAVTTESRELFAMDTVMMIRATGVDAKAAVDEAAAEIERLDALLSVGSEESEVTKLNRNGGGVMSEDVKYLTERSLEIYDSTGGAYDITIYPLMELWGFTGDHPAVPDAKEIERVIGESGSDKLKLNGNTVASSEEVLPIEYQMTRYVYKLKKDKAVNWDESMDLLRDLFFFDSSKGCTLPVIDDGRFIGIGCISLGSVFCAVAVKVK